MRPQAGAKAEAAKPEEPDGGWLANLKNVFKMPTLEPEEQKMKAVPRAYLVFDTGNAGTFFLQWTETAELLEGALAVFEPKGPVARHKLTTNGGRSELMRDVSGPGKSKRFFQAWIQFIKLANQAGGTFTFLGNVPAKVRPDLQLRLHARCLGIDHLRNDWRQPVAIFFNDTQTSVIKVPMSKPVDFTKIAAVAVIPALTTTLNVLTMSAGNFVQVGESSGATATFVARKEISDSDTAKLSPRAARNVDADN
jgi:hypothetical protein